MKEIVFYEYVIENGIVEQRTLNVKEKIRTDCYCVQSYLGERKIGEHRFIYESEFDIIKHNRVYSRENNYLKYSQLLCNYVEERVNKLRKQLKEQEMLLKKLKENIIA